MEAKDRVFLLLKLHRCPLIRSGKHLVYELPNGHSYAVPKTPSDHHSWANKLMDLRVVLGMSQRGKVKTRPAALPSKTALRKQAKAKTEAKKAAREAAQLAAPPPPPKPRVIQVKEREARPWLRQGYRHEIDPDHQNGPVRVFTKEEIEAANRAQRVGKLDEFLRNHDTARLPVVQSTVQTIKEKPMRILEVDHLSATIEELKKGMEAAQRDAEAEHTTAVNLRQQSDQAELRRVALLDKCNSIQSTIAALQLASEEMTKVRPMMGLLAQRPSDATVTDKTTRAVGKITPRGFALGAIVDVLRDGGRPMTPREIHTRLVAIEGFQNYTIGALYQTLMVDVKKNGAAKVCKAGDGIYGLVASSEPSLTAVEPPLPVADTV